MATQFKTGQIVTCTDDSNIVTLYGETKPVKGRNYTVRGVVADPSGGTGKCLRLREIVNAPAPYKTGVAECSFKASRFIAKRGK